RWPSSPAPSRHTADPVAPSSSRSHRSRLAPPPTAPSTRAAHRWILAEIALAHPPRRRGGPLCWSTRRAPKPATAQILGFALKGTAFLIGDHGRRLLIFSKRTCRKRSRRALTIP